MDFLFIETKVPFKINGHDFVVDLGEVSVGEAARQLVSTCFGKDASEDEIKETLQNVRKAIDGLLGEGASDKIFADISETNEVQIRRTALAISGEITRRRSKMVVDAFLPEEEKKEEPAKEKEEACA